MEKLFVCMAVVSILAVALMDCQFTVSAASPPGISSPPPPSTNTTSSSPSPSSGTPADCYSGSDIRPQLPAVPKTPPLRLQGAPQTNFPTLRYLLSWLVL
ncbi:hypothetical protein OWV82_010083 [Melia azedarach]|uniref:Uncharacterized protein n=1 Tax=Melia azedarach TaxID=155640 RepID=A0ACC1Y5J2_MELAZ|nr:hypothetical protein OWV82_010083 [Melia azedarach]